VLRAGASGEHRGDESSPAHEAVHDDLGNIINKELFDVKTTQQADAGSWLRNAPFSDPGHPGRQQSAVVG